MGKGKFKCAVYFNGAESTHGFEAKISYRDEQKPVEIVSGKELEALIKSYKDDTCLDNRRELPISIKGYIPQETNSELEYSWEWGQREWVYEFQQHNNEAPSSKYVDHPQIWELSILPGKYLHTVIQPEDACWLMFADTDRPDLFTITLDHMNQEEGHITIESKHMIGIFAALEDPRLVEYIAAEDIKAVKNYCITLCANLKPAGYFLEPGEDLKPKLESLFPRTNNDVYKKSKSKIFTFLQKIFSIFFSKKS
jgi:hypothetical protein